MKQSSSLIPPKASLMTRLSNVMLKVSFWACAVLFLLIAAVPLDSMTQMCVSVGVIAFVYTASSEALQHSKKKDLLRIIVIIVGTLLSIRYLIWRGLYTLDADDILSLIAMWLVFAAEVYSGVIHLLGCLVNALPLNRPALSLDGYTEEEIPTVDLLVPTYNESEELLEVTLRAALILDYPKAKLKIHLLDDGGTDQKINQSDQVAGKEALQRRQNLQALCLKLGTYYHTREKNEHAKAGNINSALENMDGELIVILDADHVPTTDFLSRTVPWMIKDEMVFLVQTPHFMANPDPVERNYFSSFTRMPSENDMFYGIIQKGLDFWSSSFFCGSAAVLRRKYLDMVGGIAGDSITEDAETALELHAKGYKSVYVEQPMISGLATETFASFIQQRIRWAQGMAQILILKKPFLNRGLTWYQKCGYMSSILFWFFPFARLIFLLSPLGYLLFGLELIKASLIEILAYTVPHIIISFRLSNFLYGNARWPLVSELYEILQSAFIFRALLTVFRNPRQPSFIVTPKGESLSETYVSSLSGIFYWLLIILSAGNIGAIYHFIESPLTREVTLMVFIWNTFNLILCLGLMKVLIEKKQLRNNSRLPAYDDVDIYDENGKCWKGNLVDLSVDGAKITLNFDQTLSETVSLLGYSNALQKSVSLSCNIMYQNIDSGEVRVKFVALSDKDKDKIIAYTLCDSSRWENFHKRRTRRISYLYGVTHVISVSVKPIFLHILMKLKQRT
ncbi:UDP-forming cellulose synthase catalytic subunit [Psychromonas sp. SP041]|uniref:UDP-forming cellulose synthase catalytic subunit n=1 Tax=Psychromonas sp. SP041 TaxID=1365007 RepID=UPI0003F6042B|nr:UDP-forming cellulose synthase catalytic subunit [Psychromonas sp. SP041]